MIDNVTSAMNYAIDKHTSANHLYDNHPYAFHLEMVFTIASEFLTRVKIPLELRDNILIACWCHDIIEDARETYNNVREEVGEGAAEIVYALTNDKGRTRRERAGDKYYKGIRATPGADFVKICDRIANMSYSKTHSKRMYKMYKKENPSFKKHLYKKEYELMFNMLEHL